MAFYQEKLNCFCTAVALDLLIIGCLESWYIQTKFLNVNISSFSYYHYNSQITSQTEQLYSIVASSPGSDNFQATISR